MKRPKLVHKIDGKEVTKAEFLTALNSFILRCDTDYENPLLNISYTDTERVKKYYRELKDKRCRGICFVGHGTFSIERKYE